MQKIKEFVYNALRKSESYFKTDMVYLAKGGFWLMAGQLFGIIVALTLSILFARLLPKETYGTYKYILTLAGILGAFSLSGMGTAVIQAVASGHKNFLNKAVRMNLVWGIVIVILGLSVSLYYAWAGNNTLAIMIAIMTIATPITNAFGLYGSFWSGIKDFQTSTILWMITYGGSSCVLVITATQTKNILPLIIIYFVSNTLGAVLAYWYTVKKNKISYSITTNTSTQSFTDYGKHLSVMNILGTLANQLDKLLLFQGAGAAPLAIYTFAQAIPEQCKGSFKNIFNIALPKYAEGNTIHLRKSITDKIIRLTIIAGAIVIAYVLAAPFIFQILFPQYHEAVIYSQIYMIGFIAIPTIALTSTYFQVVRDTHSLYIITIIGNVSTLLLTIILVPRFGIIGAVIENNISWLLMFSVNLGFFLWKTRAQDTTSRDMHHGKIV